MRSEAHISTYFSWLASDSFCTHLNILLSLLCLKGPWHGVRAPWPCQGIGPRALQALFGVHRRREGAACSKKNVFCRLLCQVQSNLFHFSKPNLTLIRMFHFFYFLRQCGFGKDRAVQLIVLRRRPSRR
jgi:hypothetical protein